VQPASGGKRSVSPHTQCHGRSDDDLRAETGAGLIAGRGVEVQVGREFSSDAKRFAVQLGLYDRARQRCAGLGVTRRKQRLANRRLQVASLIVVDDSALESRRVEKHAAPMGIAEQRARFGLPCRGRSR
jgi:hypothetical protein